MNYSVSVIIPVYNRVDLIEKTVESVISQKNSEKYQIILVDDGSTDGSDIKCDELSEKYSNVFAFHQKNAGVSAARNLGIEKSEAEWISFIDADDYILDGFFDKMLEGEDADLICCAYTGNSGISEALPNAFGKKIYYRDEVRNVLFPVMLDSYTFYQCWNKLYRKSIIDENSIRFPVGVKYAEDMIFVFNYVKFIESFKFVKEPLYFYNVNDENATTVVKKGYETHKMIYAFLSDYFKEYDTDGSIHKKLQLSFLMNSVSAINIAAVNLSFSEAVSYIKSILYDSVFSENYSERPICENSNGIFGLIGNPIQNKQAFIICLLIKLNNLRIKLMTK